MTESEFIQIEVAYPFHHAVSALRADVRPLRARFEDLALEVRTALQTKGVIAPVLEARLDLRYADQPDALTVRLPLEIENGAICLADPLPLDAQALRQAIDLFLATYAQRFGNGQQDTPLQAVLLRVVGRGVVTLADDQ